MDSGVVCYCNTPHVIRWWEFLLIVPVHLHMLSRICTHMSIYSNTRHNAAVMSAAAAILAYRYLGNKLRTADVFAIVTTFQSMRLPLIMAPLGMAALENVSVSLVRLRNFLVRPEHHTVSPISRQSAHANPGHDNANNGFGNKDTLPAMQPIIVSHVVASDVDTQPTSTLPMTLAIDVNDATFCWPGAEAGKSGSVTHISLKAATGTKTAIVGPVGSGKSTLIHGIVGELAPAQGQVTTMVDKASIG